MSPTAAAVQGACPSVHRPFHQLDGELLRVRLPGGRMNARQGAILAEVGAAVGATLELTGRANLQLRGLRASAVEGVVDCLVEAELVHPDPQIDERRNVMASPTAGFDPHEIVDIRPFVAPLQEALTRTDTPTPPTFGLLLDGGGRVHLRGRPRDVAFGAVRTNGGEVLFEVRLSDGLPTTRRSAERIPLVRPEDLLVTLEILIGSGALDDAPVDWVPAEALAPPPPLVEGPPLGVLPERDPGTVAIGVMPVLGRLVPGEWELLARLAADHGRGELRLSPWRSVLVPGIGSPYASRLLAELEGTGFVVSNQDPAAGVVACIGSRGCPAALTDTLEDARAVIAQLRAGGRQLSVHVSGCKKRCAGRRLDEYALTFVGGPEVGHYRRFRRDGGAEPEDLPAGSLGAHLDP